VRWWMFLLSLLTTTTVLAGDAVIKGFVFRDEKGMHYSHGTWSVRSESGRGWVSLKVGDAEFLSTTPSAGGIVFHRDGQWFTNFPDCSNITHDASVGRMGSVSDGIYMVRISPSMKDGSFELYAGHNDDRPAELVVFLAEEVAATPRGEGVVLRHKSGATLTVKSRCEARTMTDPSGKSRPAIVFATKGFAANSFELVPGEQRTAVPLVAAAFEVRSSDDPAENRLGAANGVKNPIYTKDTTLDYGMQFPWPAGQTFTGYAELEVIHCLGPRHFYQKVDLKDVAPGKDGKVHVKFQPKFTMPGVSDVWCRLVDADGWVNWVGRYRMGYELEAYQPKLLVQPDHKEFWDDTLKALRAQPLDAKTERVARFADHPTFELYEVSFTGWAGKRIWAMLFVPKEGQRPLPAVVTAHPGNKGWSVNKGPDGLYGSKPPQDPRFVTIVPLIRGHAPDEQSIPFNHPWWGPLDDRDTYVARSWYCAMVRALDYLATRPDLVDMKKIIASGGSQGGALALVTAALDERVAVCIADCPANCQPQEIMDHYASFGPSRGQVPAGQTVEQVQKMLSYYNPVNFCPWIKCPTYVGSNIGDLTVHSMGPLAAYHNLTALKPDCKAFYPGFTHFHGSGPGLGAMGREWRDKLSGRPPPDPKRAATTKANP